jgi:hypothetical protein
MSVNGVNRLPQIFLLVFPVVSWRLQKFPQIPFEGLKFAMKKA